MTRRYRVNVERGGDWWNLTFPDVAFVYSQTRRLDQAEIAARRALALKLDVEPQSLELDVRLNLPGDVEQARAAVTEQRDVAERAQRDAGEATRALVRSLAGQGYSVRDIGEIVGLSPQRVSQLTSTRTSSRLRAVTNQPIGAGQ